MRSPVLSAAALLALLWMAAGTPAAQEVRVVGPGGAVALRVFPHNGRLHHAVSLGGRAVVEPSPLAFSLDGVDLALGAELGERTTSRVNETYPWRGVHSRARNHCNVTAVRLRHPKLAEFSLELRAFDDAVAFRWVVPEGKGPRVPDESTTFTLPAGSTVWYHDLGGHYEGIHARKAIADVAAGDWAAPPLTFKLQGGGYASITEAALANYSGMALQADGRRGFMMALGHKHPVCYPFRLRYSKDDIERLSKPAAVAGAVASPWRVVMVGADLNALVNCDVLHNLCPPPDPRLFPRGAETEWLRPGRAVWKYLDGGESTLEGMKEFCKLAGELGFEHNVVEGFWRRFTDAQLKELVDHGRRHKVGIWLWKHCKELRDPADRKAFLGKCRDLGVAGVKLDFFDHEAKEMIDHYEVLLREAAEHRLMVNFHGSNKPTGESRTWPNELVRESVKGMEASRLQGRARHDATLPFTRFLAGHADYTPVHFGPRKGDTTLAHQVATAAVFTAPLLTYGAHPRKLLDSPCLPMIKSIPATWDETIVLSCSEIGELAALARRKGDAWFLAVVNGPSARTVKVPLTFLGPAEYRTLVVRDQKDDPSAADVQTGLARRADTLSLDLSAGGGFIARFEKK